MNRDQDIAIDKAAGQDKMPDLPLRQDVPLEERGAKPKEKSIHDTLGAKITHAFIYYALGFGANSGLSVGITYLLMPREWVKKPKEAIAKSMSAIFKGPEKDRLRTANGTLEIMIMLVAGTLLTAGMIPLAKNREKIAHWLNQKMGKDADVLPDDMKAKPEPKTIEDKIEQEIDKRVDKRHNSGDLWKARWSAVAVPFFGDMALSNWNNKREAQGKWSADTKVWEAGGKFYDKVLSKSKVVDRVSHFFETHGAGVKDIQERAPEKFHVLEAMEKETAGAVNNSRIMVAEQSRMLAKEVGWTIILAAVMDKLVGVYHGHRVKKEQRHAIEEVTREGLVPEGYKVTLEDGVKLEKIGPTWAEKNVGAKPRPVKADNFVATVDNSRTGAEQPVLG